MYAVVVRCAAAFGEDYNIDRREGELTLKVLTLRRGTACRNRVVTRMTCVALLSECTGINMTIGSRDL